MQYVLIDSSKIQAISLIDNSGIILYNNIYDFDTKHNHRITTNNVPFYLVAEAMHLDKGLPVVELLSQEPVKIFEDQTIISGLLIPEDSIHLKPIDISRIGSNYRKYTINELEEISKVLKDMSLASSEAIKDYNIRYEEYGKKIINTFTRKLK